MIAAIFHPFSASGHNPSQRNKRSSPRAFSLLELVIAITILGIMLGISAPKIIHSLSVGKIRSETNMLVSVIKYLQGMAALQRASYFIHFNLDNQSYYVTRSLSKADDFEVTTADMVGGRNDSLFAGDLPSSMEYNDDIWSSPFSSYDEQDDIDMITNRNVAGRVSIFDEDLHRLPADVSIVKIVDSRGDEHVSGNYSLILDPKGYAVDSRVFLTTTGNNSDPVYVVHIGANGVVRVTIEDAGL